MKFFKTKAILLALLSLGNLKLTQAEDIKYQASNIDNGIILHAHTWTFNTIKEKLPDIKNAGYTAIQTSPITKCYHLDNWSSEFWYWPYQPVSYEIGNYLVGTEEEFKSLCAEAKKYNLKIIVDVVLNHMTSHSETIEYPFTKDGYIHKLKYGEALNEGCRNEITQMELIGLKDINTQNPEVQQVALNLLKRMLADGASGFRFDAAKHIELPDDHLVGSNYWNVVLDNGAEFQYGEALQTSVSREKDYSKIMKLTASNYGFNLRDAIENNDFSIGRIADYNITVTTDKLITWVESHDNYSNESKESTSLTNEEITLAWSLLASRKDTTPLFFPRPRGGGGNNPQFPSGTYIGQEGDPLYKSKAITEINIFHNSMEGEMENLRNINNEKVLMIERGKRGVVIINLNGSQTSISSDTLLADGSYTDHISNNVFTVSNGKITGNLLPRSATVLYNSNGSTSDPYIGVKGYPIVSDNEFIEEYIDISLEAKNLKRATYSINGQEEIEFQNGKSIRIGEGIDSGKTNIFLSGQNENNEFVSAYYTFTKLNTKSNFNIYYKCETNVGFNNCDFMYAYVYCEDGDGKAIDIKSTWPGTLMEKTSNNLFKLELQSSYNSLLYDMSKQCYVFFTQNYTHKVGINDRMVKSPYRDEGYTLIANAIYQYYNYYGQYDLIYGEKKPMTTSIVLPFTTTRPATTTTTTTTTTITTTTTTPTTTTTTTIITTTTTTTVPTSTTSTTTTTTPLTTTTTTTSTIFITSTITASTTTTTTTTTIIATPTENPYITVYFEKPSNWNSNNIRAYTYYESGSTTRENVRWPGELMTVDSDDSNVYAISIEKELDLNRIIFNDGSNQTPGSGKTGFEIKDLGLYNYDGYVRQYRDECGNLINVSNTVTIYYYSSWSPAYIHYQYGSNAWTVVPGVPMTPYKDGYQTITIDIGKDTAITFVCNNNYGNWDNNNGRNYYISSPGSYILKNGQISSGSI